MGTALLSSTPTLTAKLSPYMIDARLAETVSFAYDLARKPAPETPRPRTLEFGNTHSVNLIIEYPVLLYLSLSEMVEVRPSRPR